MRLLFLLGFLTCTDAVNLRLDPSPVPTGQLLTFQCNTTKPDDNVWALVLTVNATSNYFQYLWRLDGSPPLLLNADGRPQRVKKYCKDCPYLEYAVRVHMATNGTRAECKSLLIGGERGAKASRQILVFRPPSANLTLVTGVSLKKKTSAVTEVPAKGRVNVECLVDMGEPPVPEASLKLRIRKNFLPKVIAICKETDRPDIVRCRWQMVVEDSLNGATVACVFKVKDKIYSSNETEFRVVSSQRLRLEGNIYACDLVEFFSITVYVRGEIMVQDILDALKEEYPALVQSCNIKEWRIRRNVGHYKKTGEKVILVKSGDQMIFVNSNGIFVTSELRAVSDLEWQRLALDENFNYVKDYVNSLDVIGDS